MHGIYVLVSGPLLWISVILFFGGSIYKITRMMVGVYKKERFIISFLSLKYSLRSIFHWAIPFGAVVMRNHPIMTIVTFAFHICLLAVPLFLFSHVVLFDESWNINWWTLPGYLAHIMTIIVIVSCVFFLFRRLRTPEVRFVTSFSDYLILAMVAAPFITGFWVVQQWPASQWMLISHMLSGEIMLAAIPFTRLSHMLFLVFTRVYIASEFGDVRKARDW